MNGAFPSLWKCSLALFVFVFFSMCIGGIFSTDVSHDPDLLEKINTHFASGIHPDSSILVAEFSTVDRFDGPDSCTVRKAELRHVHLTGAGLQAFYKERTSYGTPNNAFGYGGLYTYEDIASDAFEHTWFVEARKLIKERREVGANKKGTDYLYVMSYIDDERNPSVECR
jgi:hypothetical protein